MTSKTFMLRHVKAPIIAAPMFIVSTPKMVVNQCKAGIIGSFPALNARNEKKESTLNDWLVNIKNSLDNDDIECPLYAVNQIVHKSNDRLMEDMETIVRHEVPIVITSLGAKEEINEAVHSYGGVVLHDVTNNKHAKKAYEKGADGLIAVAAGAGGHAGSLSPFALIQEIREWFDGPLALSGAISNGKSVAAAVTMGADFAYIGSPFIATTDANASDEYKKMVIDSTSEDIVNTNMFTGIHGNYLGKSISLEPGNQIELAGDKLKNIHQVCFEGNLFQNQLDDACDQIGLSSMAIGYDPYTKLGKAPNNPKARYKVMTKEMPKGGNLSLNMMYQTAGTQINLDYISENDFIKKFKLIASLTPLSIGIFANSPVKEKKLTKYLSYRSKVWQSTSRGG